MGFRLALIPLALLGAAGCSRARGDAAASNGPIPFDHSLHAGTNKIACLFCHSYAETSQVAGIPAVRKCISCHDGVAIDKPAIKALTALYERGEAPSWTKEHDLPDYVYFSHRMHLRAGLDCTQCHGQVGSMKTVTPTAPLTMGWCMGCHKQRQASIDCLTCHK